MIDGACATTVVVLIAASVFTLGPYIIAHIISVCRFARATIFEVMFRGMLLSSSRQESSENKAPSLQGIHCSDWFLYLQ